MKKIIQTFLLVLATGCGVLFAVSTQVSASDTCSKEWEIVLRKQSSPIYAGTHNKKIHFPSSNDTIAIIK